MKVGEACFEQPFFEEVVGHYGDTFLVGDGLATEFVDSHLEETFAELANSVWDH